MPLIQCPDCNKEMSDAAPACPNCGRPNDVIEIAKPTASKPLSSHRKVSIPLIIGIIIIPIIASWLTLRKGYSTTARVVSFAWLMLTFVIISSGGDDNKPVSTTPEPAPATVTKSITESPAAAKSIDESPAEPQAAKLTETEDVQEANKPAEPAEKEIINTTFNLTPAQFKNKFNAKTKQLENNLTITKLNIEDGKINNSFKYMFNKSTGLVGTIDKKTGKIISFMFLFGGSQDQQEILHAVAVPLFISQIVNPEQAKSKTSKVIMEMISESLSKMNDGETIKNKIGSVQYSSVASQYTGLMLSIEPVSA
ncbi:MAG: hypothetical protein ACRC2U_19470 [Aeromonas sp.]